MPNFKTHTSGTENRCRMVVRRPGLNALFGKDAGIVNRIMYAMLGLTLAWQSGFAPNASAQLSEEQTIQMASAVLTETMSTPGSQIPQAMLADAHGVAIIPNVIKGSFVVGARHGRGVLFIREADGAWHAPVFITLTGGNVGWQIGLQSSDIILVFKTQQSVQGILSGKLTLGADAAAAAGPVGRQTAMATDGRLQAEIYTYSRSRGLFAGVSIDGSVLRVDQAATSVYYQNAIPGQPMVIPPAAQQLTQAVAAYAAPTSITPAPSLEAAPITNTIPIPTAFPAPAAGSQPSVLVQPPQAGEAEMIRSQLAQLAPKLYELVDAQWKGFLALPPSMMVPGGTPNATEIAQTLQHYDRVATDPAFAQLAARPEFQSIYGMLKRYQLALDPNSSSVQLPPPPNSNAPRIR